ncbi:arsenate reductase ArsC (plasmid) [Devosia neptuniae]|uniref:Arsenate reductase ArsC n=1 Tax=Devosia neptuniae TaxID=191302 RepID=A0ABY6C6U5_9HYPH|nr:arsenate reductase ArsC [Devosia neptuniae]UXN67862.1 arsenate reductase ArsC [Devosia neptuniae]
MQNGTYHILFLSRRNSARSIMAEAILNKIGNGRFRASSAAIDPADSIDPTVLQLMRDNDLQVSDTKPKHFREFAASGASDIDFVFTLSDTAAGEALPEWPGLPITAHWSSSDPILAEGEDWEKKRAFVRVMTEIERRLNIFINLPFESLDRMSLQSHMNEIGNTSGDT